MKMYFLLVFLLMSYFSVYCQAVNIYTLGLKAPPLKNCTPVKDQYYSSTCWSFSSLSFMESEALRKGRGVNDLSEMFVTRYSYIRKIETHLQLKGGNYFTPGGQFHDVPWVMKRYGIVPEAVYSGKVNGEPGHNHQQLDTAILHFVNTLLQQKINTLNILHYHILDSILTVYLGKPPSLFTYNGVQYTPKTFLEKYLQINPDDYVEITSYTHHPFYRQFVLEDKYNWTGDKYFNVPIYELLSITNTALQNGYTLSWDGDVEEQTFNFKDNIAYLPQPILTLQSERQSTFIDGTTSIDHMMHIVALTKDKKGNDWYFIKNSWGADANTLNGYLFMSRDYFAIKTGAIIVNKNAIPPEIRKKMRL